MAVLFSGDFHANAQNELNIITKASLIKKYQLDKYNDINYHIILGDGGFLWPGNRKTDLFNYEALAHRTFPILCVVGNHEPILGMNDVPEVDIGIGETVYQIQVNPFVAYLKRGKIYTIDGFRMLVLGGALSVDKIYREPNISWWEREYWSDDEKQDIFKLLETENVFDCVISHTGPQCINQKVFEIPMVYSKKFKDEVAILNDEIRKRIQFIEWWCGHWHQDVYYYENEKGHGYQYLYKSTKILDRRDSKIVVYSEYGQIER
jgi:hypothetical protein